MKCDEFGLRRRLVRDRHVDAVGLDEFDLFMDISRLEIGMVEARLRICETAMIQERRMRSHHSWSEVDLKMGR